MHTCENRRIAEIDYKWLMFLESETISINKNILEFRVYFHITYLKANLGSKILILYEKN